MDSRSPRHPKLSVFYFEDGLQIPALGLSVDVARRQPRGFVSHGHFDHLAAHELAFCSPITARFYQRRLGGRRWIRELPYGEPHVWDDHRLTTFPAGHILGSSMLLVESPRESLLYTGDFRLRKSETAEPAAPPRADLLVMECTFGEPRYRVPPREVVVPRLIATLRQSLDAGLVPVVFAYALGKAQEVTRILRSAGLRVLQHPSVFALSQEYEAAGCDLGGVEEYQESSPLADAVLVFPPPGRRAAGPQLPNSAVTIAVTGWALDERYKFRTGVDYAFPLSDHADFDELLECVERVSPRQVYCWHGQEPFVDELRRRGWDAYWLPRVRRPRVGHA